MLLLLFVEKGKKSAWLTWDVCAEASDVFKKLRQYPPTVTDEDLKVLEKFVITMYDRYSTTTCVNDARLDLFARKQRSYEAIPPTESALLQHNKRAAYQAECVWSQATVCRPEAQSPANWGWIKHDQVWKICWTTLPHSAASCQELTKCGCKTECHGRCNVIAWASPAQPYVVAHVRTNPCPVLDHKTYFGLYILSSMFLYTSPLKLLNNYENKQIILWCWCK